MGCTHEASLEVSDGFLLREERTYEGGLVATETLAVEQLAVALR